MLRLAGLDRVALGVLLSRYGMELRLVPAGEDIPGSYWGDSEAGLKGAVLYARPDTPLHSVLHEAAHYICMTPERRSGLDRDAGGDDAEECAVCYLQLLLSTRAAAVWTGPRLCGHGRVGLQLPAGLDARLVRAGCGRCAAVAALQRALRTVPEDFLGFCAYSPRPGMVVVMHERSTAMTTINEGAGTPLATR